MDISIFFQLFSTAPVGKDTSRRVFVSANFRTNPSLAFASLSMLTSRSVGKSTPSSLLIPDHFNSFWHESG